MNRFAAASVAAAFMVGSYAPLACADPNTKEPNLSTEFGHGDKDDITSGSDNIGDWMSDHVTSYPGNGRSGLAPNSGNANSQATGPTNDN